MAYLKQRELQIEKTGQTVSIPKANMARLMYYLESVNSLTDFGIPYELRDYDNYSKLSFDQENQVIALAFLLSPDVFVDKGIMVNEPRLCQGCNNEFYKITDNRTARAATLEFIIAGKTVHTLSIMAFKMSWIQNNFIDPINFYDKRLRAIADGTVDKMRPRQLTSSRTSGTNYRAYVTSTSYKKKKKSKMCTIC